VTLSRIETPAQAGKTPADLGIFGNALANFAERGAGLRAPGLEQCFRLDKLAEVLSRTLNATLSVERVPGPTGSGQNAVQVQLVGRQPPIELRVSMPPDLAAHAIAQLLGRSLPPADPKAPLGPGLEGALAALLLDVARQLSQASIFELGEARGGSATETYHARVRLEGRVYGAQIARIEGEESAPWRSRLEQLDTLPLELGLELSHFTLDPQAAAALAANTTVFSGQPWDGTAVLRVGVFGPGLAVRVEDQGLVIFGVAPPPPDENPRSPALHRLVTGSVSLDAAHWARLQVGDGIMFSAPTESHAKLLGPSGLLAEGKLCECEGKLGIAVTSLPDRPTDSTRTRVPEQVYP
jgi:hypothetical protein